MKNIALLLVLGLCVASCADFLEEDLSTLITSESGALSNEAGLTAALAGAYKPLTATWGSGLGNASTQAILMGSDPPMLISQTGGDPETRIAIYLHSVERMWGSYNPQDSWRKVIS